MRLLWLPQVLRSAGLTVVEVSGWQTRGGETFEPRGTIAHATAGSRTSTDKDELNVLLNGSSSAPPPIAQLMLSRSGVWYVVASGRCNHVLTGWGGPHSGYGNTYLIGIEAMNDNRGEPWSSDQLNSYARGVRAIHDRMGWPASRCAGHKEHQPGAKTDPTFDMNEFRSLVSGAGGLLDMNMSDQVPGIGIDVGTWMKDMWVWAATQRFHEQSPRTDDRFKSSATGPGIVSKALNTLLQAASSDEARDSAAVTAIEALAAAVSAGGGSVDSAPIITRINEVAAEERAVVQELQARMADLLAELEEYREAERAAAVTKANRLDDDPATN